MCPAEAIEYKENGDGSHFYSAWYFVVGRIAQLNAKDSISDEDLPAGAPIVVDEKVDLIPAGFPDPHFRIEIYANLPWLMAERP